jgi:hypothetical protein
MLREVYRFTVTQTVGTLRYKLAGSCVEIPDGVQQSRMDDSIGWKTLPVSIYDAFETLRIFEPTAAIVVLTMLSERTYSSFFLTNR